MLKNQWMKLLLSFTILFISFLNITVDALNTTPDINNDNLRYSVGNFYYEIWRYSDGVNWTAEGKPDTWKNIRFDYSFSHPGRKIKNVFVKEFDPGEELSVKLDSEPTGAQQVYKEARYGATWEATQAPVSKNYTAKIEGSVQGYGTDRVSFKVHVNGLLTAIKEAEVTSENRPDLGGNVLGLRYYFPFLIVIEFESEGGKVVIKHFTTSGKSLNGVEGFSNREERLEKGKPYTPRHTPESASYKYAGYKKSTTGPISGGTISNGDPPAIPSYQGGYDYHINYYYEETDGGEHEEGGGSGACTWTIEPPRKANTRQSAFMNPNATGVLEADDLNNDNIQFEVRKGIPTSEHLFANTIGRNYLYQHSFDNMQGKVKYTCKVDVTYSLKWKEKQPDKTGPDGKPVPQPDKDMSAIEAKSYFFELTRDYSYWQIDQLEVYKIKQAKMKNYALPGGVVTLNPNEYSPPAVRKKNTDIVNAHIRPKDTGEINFTPPVVEGKFSRPSVPDDTSKLKTLAEAQTKEPDVQNDTLIFIFNGQETTVMDGRLVSKNGPEPGNIPQPGITAKKVLYKDKLLISKTLLNKADTPSSGTIFYALLPENVKGSGDKEYPIEKINTITVHTPVVIYANVTDDKPHNQKTEPNPDRAAFILERPLSVFMPTSGGHRNIPGYGNRDYAKYFRSKEVKFPFDTFSADKGTFYPKQTWISIPVPQERTEFFLPVWVDEGDYTVEFRATAENAPANVTGQRKANTDLQHHRAQDTVDVEVIGRLYDFQITDIADYNWASVFRANNGKTPKGTSYWVGKGDIDGAPRGNGNPYVLSIAPGSHPDRGHKNVAVKTGYHFKFEVKTKGNMFGKQDGVRITPTFSFVSKDGTKRQPVDLYYHSNTKRFIRIGSKEDTERRFVILNDRMRNVPMQELMDTALYIYDNYYSFSQVGRSGRQQFVEDYIRKAKEKTLVGTYDWMILPYQVRTLIGPKEVPSGVSIQRAYASIQKWYGEYSLPADVYAVPKGTNLAEYGRKHRLGEKAPIFLRDGYIIVSFNIESIRDAKVERPHLQYIHAPLMNQWQLEGYLNTYTDPYGNRFNLADGDVVFYHGDKSSRDDFGAQVPH